MTKPLSLDRRQRVAAAIEAGMSRRAATARFGIAPSAAVTWRRLWLETGSVAPRAQGGDTRSGRIEATGPTIHGFFRRHGWSFKKSPPTRASRTARTSPRRARPYGPCIARNSLLGCFARAGPDHSSQGFDAQPDLDPERLIFIDETWLNTKMARLRRRAPKGERLRAGVPHGHWRTTTFVTGLRLSGIDAPMLIDGVINGESFLPPCSPTSTRSKTPSPSSRRSSGRAPPAHARPCGPKSPAPSKPSPEASAPTTSQPQAVSPRG